VLLGKRVGQVIALGELGKARSQGVKVLRGSVSQELGLPPSGLSGRRRGWRATASVSGRPSVRARFLVFLLKIAVSGAGTHCAPARRAGVGGFRARAKERALGVIAAK
jgi:hypothetical protein